MWFKVKIISCARPDYWYANKIGDTILVKEPYENSWGFEAKNGFSVFRHDVERVAQS